MAGTNGKTLICGLSMMDAETCSNEALRSQHDHLSSLDQKPKTRILMDQTSSRQDLWSTVWFSLLISDQIADVRDLVNLACASKAHYEVLIKKLYRSIHMYFSDEALKSRHRVLSPSPGDSRLQRMPWSAAEAMARCWLDDRLVGRAHYLTCQDKNYGRYTSVFRFSGTYPSTAWGQLWDRDGNPPDPWKLQLDKLGDLINLQEYQADVDWRLADMDQVLKLPFSMKSLTVPVRYAKDCGTLATALKRLGNLESLTILSLPVLDEFVDEFPDLADGLIARASSLRSLIIELTAHSRPYSWETDDFVHPEPEEWDLYFRSLFPTPVRNGGSNPRLPIAYRDQNDPMQRDTVFQLTFLGLQHFGIPADAFQDMFSKEHIKDLCLPNCKVRADFWTGMKGFVNLRSLRNIDYDLLTPQLVGFLGTQRELETLTFSKPLPERQLLGIEALGEGMSLWYQTGIIETGEPQHQGLVHLGKVAFRNLPNLRTLHLPADMYDISRQDLQYLCEALPRLERIELALNYKDLDLLLIFNDVFVRMHPRLRKITFLSCLDKDPLDLLRYREQLRKPRIFCQGVKYLRYILLDGERQTHYETSGDPVTGEGVQHLKLHGEEGDEIFDEERTPMIYPLPRLKWELEEECRKERLSHRKST